MRVVSLLPSATEICFALGVEPVGVSHECDYPPAARDLPAVNDCNIAATGSSSDVNEQVADAESGEGVYTIDRDRLAALDPDLVITQGVCDVCAVDRVLVREAIDDCELDTEVCTLDVHSLDDLYRAIEEVGAACGRSDEADALIDDLGGRVDAVEARASRNAGDHVDASTSRNTDAVQASGEAARRKNRDRAATGPRVAVLDWLDPVMVAGHWVPELVEIAGGRYGMEAAGAHSRPREWAEVREYDPEVLVVSPCGFELSQVRENLAEVTERPGWGSLTAVEDDRVYLVDGHHYVNRAGPRLVDTLEFLAATIRPDDFERPPRDAVQRLGSRRA